MPSLKRFTFVRIAFAFALLLLVAGASGYLLVTRPAINQFAKWIASDLIPEVGHCNAESLTEAITTLNSKGFKGIELDAGNTTPSSDETNSALHLPFDSLLAEQLQQRDLATTRVKSSLAEATITLTCGANQVVLHFDRSDTLGALPDRALLFWVIGLIGSALGMAALLAKSLSVPLSMLSAHLRSTPLGADTTASQLTHINEFDLLAQEIDDLRTRASSAVASRSALLMSLSHDLRKPLTRIRLILDIETQLDEPTIQEMRQDILELQDALDEFMRAANAMASPAQPDGAEIVWNHLKRIYTDPRLTISGGPTESCAPINPTALIRICTNLIDNALQHTEGNVIVNWECGLLWKIFIIDHGSGIDSRFISQESRPFKSSSTQTESAPFHAGLGLSLVHILCEHNGWKVGTGKTKEGLSFICIQPIF